MSHQKRRSQSAKKPLTEKQLVIAQRSRSIKTSLLRILSNDAVALYRMNPNNNHWKVHRKNQAKSIIEDQISVAQNEESTQQRSLESNREEIQAEVNPPKINEQHILNQQDEKQKELLVTVLISRLIAFCIGILVHYVIHSYFFNQLFVLSCIAIAVSTVSVLITVVFMPWNRKLLWNLCSLLGGLLFAVIAL
ncbi:MAG: GtrA family protein [Leptolyngbya sp. Prado105]|jgi:hypothetical protein|nr:GtrA family protein [Leptolyngbya sp. Prado105]